MSNVDEFCIEDLVWDYSFNDTTKVLGHTVSVNEDESVIVINNNMFNKYIKGE